MSTITIEIPDDRLLRLKEAAARLGISAEELVRLSIDALLARPEEEFKSAMDYVLKKNADLYRRLA